MKINIETIPYEQMRYKTAGDYYLDQDGTYQVRISSLSTQTREMAVALHEIWEMFEVLVKGISFATIDQFDRKCENTRQPGNTDEPGDDPKAPYHQEHVRATGVERLFMAIVGENWQEYEKEVGEL